MAEKTQEGSLFRLPGYPAWFCADTGLWCASAVHRIAMSMVAYQLSGSLPAAGWFATARSLVSFVTGTIGGTYVDRHDYRKLVLVQAGSCALLWAIMGVLFSLGRLTFALFVILCLASSAIFGFLGNTTNAALLPLVGPQRYAQAESLNQGRDAAISMAVQPLGGALYGIAPSLPFFASAFFDLISFFAGLRMQVPQPDRADLSEDEAALMSFLRDLVSGWKWMASKRRVMEGVVMEGLLAFGMFGIFQTINLNLVATDTDPVLISLVNVVSGAAMMLGSVVSARLCDRIPAGKGAILTLAATAAAMVPMMVWGTYPAILLSALLMGLPRPLFSALVMGFMFARTPQELQGRAHSAASTAVSLFTIGVGAVSGNLLPVIGFGGLVAVFAAFVLAAALIALASPRIRLIPASPQWESVEL